VGDAGRGWNADPQRESRPQPEPRHSLGPRTALDLPPRPSTHPPSQPLSKFLQVLTKTGLFNIPAWYEAGKVYYQNPDAIPFTSLLAVQFFLFNFVEIKRLEDMKNPGSQAEKGTFLGFESQFKGTGMSGYPGGIFDPMGMASGSASSVAELKQKEIKNARLAMVAFLGFCAQYSATGKGPVDNLLDHLANPWGANFASNGVSLPVSIF
jgi:hypothetical protein